MSSVTPKVLQLRQLLAERFGQPDLAAKATLVTSLAALDEIGLPQAALTEIVSSPEDGPGGGLLLYSLLHALLHQGERVVLVDGKKSVRSQRAFANGSLPLALGPDAGTPGRLFKQPI